MSAPLTTRSALISRVPAEIAEVMQRHGQDPAEIVRVALSPVPDSLQIGVLPDGSVGAQVAARTVFPVMQTRAGLYAPDGSSAGDYRFFGAEVYLFTRAEDVGIDTTFPTAYRVRWRVTGEIAPTDDYDRLFDVVGVQAGDAGERESTCLTLGEANRIAEIVHAAGCAPSMAQLRGADWVDV